MLITKKRYKAEIIPMFIFPVSSIQVAQSYSFIVYSYALGVPEEDMAPSEHMPWTIHKYSHFAR